MHAAAKRKRPEEVQRASSMIIKTPQSMEDQDYDSVVNDFIEKGFPNGPSWCKDNDPHMTPKVHVDDILLPKQVPPESNMHSIMVFQYDVEKARTKLPSEYCTLEISNQRVGSGDFLFTIWGGGGGGAK